MTRWRRRSSSSTGVSSSTGNGGVADSASSLGLGDLELDLAGVQARVDVALLAAHDRAGGRDDVLGAQALGERVGLRGGLGVEDELDDARSGRAGR